MRVYGLFTAGLALWAAWCPAANLLRNPEFRGDNLGGLLNWSLGGVADVRKGAGPDGANVLHLTAANGRSLGQFNFQLVAGERYRFGAKVRTKGVRKARLVVYNSAWTDSANIYLPADTKGEWRDLVWQDQIFPSANGHYYFRLFCDEELGEGEIDLAAPILEPSTEAAAKGAAPTVLETPRKVRIVPIDPLLAQLNAAAAKMEFYYPGDLEKAPENYAFAAALADGKTVEVPLDARCRGTVSFGAIAEGSHQLKVRLVDRETHTTLAADAYPVVAHVPFTGARGKPLNNFVTELQRVSVEAGREIAFDNPREGWVYIGFAEPSAHGQVWLDRAAAPVVLPREHESCDTLRFLAAGRHTLKTDVAATLVVHAVKLTFMAAGGDLSEVSTLDRFQYGLDFRRRYFFNRFARYDDFNWTRQNAEQRRWSEIYEAHGAVYGGEARLGADAATWGQPEKLLNVITNCAPYRDGLPVSLDESSPVATRLNHATLAEAAWRLADSVQPIGIWWNDCLRNVCSDPRGQAVELSAVANSGWGRGLLLPEVYVLAYPDRERVRQQEDHFVEFLSSIRAQVPAATQSFLLSMGGYTLPIGWCAWIAPETDLKVLYDDLVHRFATDPACHDIGGLGYTFVPRCDEEIVRWFCRLVRHYAIEGRTDKLAPKFGFTYYTKTVRNNDFDRGLESWTAHPAESGAIAVTNVVGFGTNLQGRKMSPTGYGDNLVVFTRSAKRPNRLTQKVSGLTPGRLYALACASVDVDDYAKPNPRGDEVVFKLGCGQGGEIISELCYDYSGILDRRPDGHGPWTRGPETQRMVHRIVFRATASETEISFSDWADDKTPGGTIGARRMFNHVNLRPYYVENEEELADLRRIFPFTRRRTSLDAPVWPNVKSEFYDTKSNPACCPGNPAFSARFISSTNDTGKGGSRSFRLSRTFTLRAKPIESWLQAMGDDQAVFKLNGTPVADARYSRSVLTPRSRPDVREVTGHLQAGQNEIVAEYTTSRNFPGGVVAELFVRYADGTFERIETDETWSDAVASDPPPAPNRWVKMPYRDFAAPQQSSGVQVSPRTVTAGQPLQIRCGFAGHPPTNDFVVVLTLNRGKTVFDRREVMLGPTNVTATAKGRWELSFAAPTPLYFNSGDFELAMESDAICLRTPVNTLPLGKISLRRVAAAPGFAQPLESCVKMWQGSPEVFVNGEPFFLMWGATAGVRRPDVQPRIGDLPLNAVKVVSECRYWNPKPGVYDFTYFDREAEEMRRAQPGAYFIWDLNVYPSRAWGDANRPELATDDTGEITGDHWREEFSYPSRKAKDELKAMVENAIRYLESSPYANRILGYRVTSGYTIEWLGWKAKKGRVLDFSKPAQEEFRTFAAEHYPMIKDASVPSARERDELDDGGLLWDPQKHLRTIAYYEFYSQAVADCALELCRHAKEILGNRKIVGTYYGYTMYLNVTGTDQMRAHFALEKLLRENNGAIDYLMSPQCYGHRRLGDSCLEMKPFASLAANGILSIIEDDTRTHSRPAPSYSGYYQNALTEEQSLAVLRRDMSIALCHRSPAYYYALDFGTELDFPAMVREGSILRTVGEHCLKKGVRRQAEVAVVVSEKSITHMAPIPRWAPNGDYYQRYLPSGTVEAGEINGAIFAAQVFGSNLTRFARAGAPVDYVLAEDLPRHVGDYKFYVFQNAFVWDDAFKAAVEAIRARGATILWLYAPGCIKDGTLSLANMKALTGIDFAAEAAPAVAGVTLKADGRFMGMPKVKVNPLFYPVKPDVTLGLSETGHPGLAAVKIGKSVSVFSNTWQIDVPFLSLLEKKAGVHIYSDSTDPVEANDCLFTLHARFPGRKTVRLPRRTTVLDVFAKRIIARNAESFTFAAPLHSTFLFYCADDAEELLKKLKHELSSYE